VLYHVDQFSLLQEQTAVKFEAFDVVGIVFTVQCICIMCAIMLCGHKMSVYSPVSPSVTGRYCIEMAKHIIKLFFTTW